MNSQYTNELGVPGAENSAPGTLKGQDDTQLQKLDNYRFSPDELRVLKQCNRDSFYQRCLPFSTVFGGMTYFAVKSGFLKGSVRFGAVPKVIAAVTVGYFAGKFSYQTKCAEKLMQIPNSRVGEMLRQKRRQGNTEILTMEPGFGSSVSLPTLGDYSSTDTYSDVPRHDLDSKYPAAEGLDDSFRPTLDSPIIDDDTLPDLSAQQHKTTYEELRRKNRDEYEQKRIKSYSREDVPSTLRPRAQQPEYTPPPQSSRPQNWNREKNRYGDVWEE